MTNGVLIQTGIGFKGNKENQIRNAKSFATFLSYDLSYKGLKVSPGVRYEKVNIDFQNYGTADNDCHHKKIYIKIKFNMKSLQKSTFIFTFV